MVIMDVIRDTRGGLKYLWNACRYLENDEKSVYTGGYGVNPYNLNTTYRQIVSVRQYYEKTSGNPLMHFMISFDETVQTEETAILLTQNLAAFSEHGIRFYIVFMRSIAAVPAITRILSSTLSALLTG